MFKRSRRAPILSPPHWPTTFSLNHVFLILLSIVVFKLYAERVLIAILLFKLKKSRQIVNFQKFGVTSRKKWILDPGLHWCKSMIALILRRFLCNHSKFRGRSMYLAFIEPVSTCLILVDFYWEQVTVRFHGHASMNKVFHVMFCHFTKFTFNKKVLDNWITFAITFWSSKCLIISDPDPKM